MAWYKRFIPELVINSYQELTVDTLHKLNCRLILIDIDNTLAAHDEPLPSEDAKVFIDKLKEAGFIVVLISNNTVKRVKLFASALDLPYYPMAKKPLPKAYKQAMKDYLVKSSETVSLGDQLMTDVWGSHNAGIKAIWTRPLSKKELVFTNINRFFERIVYRKLVKEGYINE